MLNFSVCHIIEEVCVCVAGCLFRSLPRRSLRGGSPSPVPAALSGQYCSRSGQPVECCAILGHPQTWVAFLLLPSLAATCLLRSHSEAR